MIRELTSQLVHKEYRTDEFIRLMKQFGFPFTMNESRVSDFLITNGTNAGESLITMGLPSVFDAAEFLVNKYDSRIYAEIENRTPVGKVLENLNYRDIWLEMFHGIYINPWEIHTVFEIGESQKMVILLLEKFGYIHPKVTDFNSIIYHTEMMDLACKQEQAIKVEGRYPSGQIVPIFYINPKLLPPIGLASISAYIGFKSTLGEKIENPMECFYRIDTSYKVLGHLPKEYVDRYFDI